MRYRQVFDADQFQGLSGVISQVAYRVDDAFGGPSTSNPINIEINMSHSSVTSTNMSPIFANNIDPDETLVLDAMITLSSAESPANFDMVVDLNDLLAYNGLDDLLLDVRVYCRGNTTAFDVARDGVGQGGTPWCARLWALGVDSTTGSSNGDDGYATEFMLDGATPVEDRNCGSISRSGLTGFDSQPSPPGDSSAKAPLAWCAESPGAGYNWGGLP
ncbi:MAG: hypothetical protein GY842_13545 [bacterium]|nr:hypothetical protein [bacterium]